MKAFITASAFLKNNFSFRTVIPVLLAVLFLSFLMPGSGKAAYFVDDAGLDGNPGTFLQPFRTVRKAADCMMTNATSSTCYIFPGVYPDKVVVRSNRNAGPLVFTRLSNTVAHPVMNGSLQSNFAFKLTNTSRVILSGLAIMKYTNGIVFSGRATNNRILSCAIYSNNYYGIFIASDNADKNYIQGNHFWGQNQNNGVCISNGDYNTVRSNIFRRNQSYGVYLCGTATGNSINRNSIYSNNGIYINSDTADNNSILTNNIRGITGQYGISINDGDNNTIRSNRISRCSMWGTYIVGSATGNSFVKNSIYSNPQAGFSIQSDTADNNMILTNDIWGMNQQYGMYLMSGDNTIIRFNRIHHNQIYGIYIIGSTFFNLIARNTIRSNDRYGVYIGSFYADNDSIFSNDISGLSQDFGVYIKDGSEHRVYHNLFNRSQSNAICLAGATNIRIYNNTIFGALNHGALAISSSATLINNIILSNGSGAGDYGVRRTGALPVYLAHNCLYGNYSGPTNGGCVWATPNFTADPMLETVTSFTIVSKNSPAIDTGKVIPGCADVYQGDAPDLGCRESSFGQGPFFVDDNTGSDLNNGGFYSPYRTIQRAVQRMAPGMNVTSATCYVFPGNYNAKVAIFSNKNPDWMVFTKLSNASPVMRGTPASNSAFKLTNASRVVISGFRITGYSNGVVLRGISADNRILRSTVCSNKACGIYIQSDNADDNEIRGNDLFGTNQDTAVRIIDGDNNAIRSNRIDRNRQFGIYLSGSATGSHIAKNSMFSNRIVAIYLNSETANNNRIFTNHIWANGGGQNAVALYYANNNIIQSNCIHHYGNSGVYLFNSACSNQIVNNQIYSNDAMGGIYFDAADLADNNLIAGNDIWGLNQSYGVLVANADGNTIVSNRIHHNFLYGIYLSGTAQSNTVRGNALYNNSTGICINNGDKNTVRTNQVCRNTGYGIYLESAACENSIVKNSVYSNNSGISVQTAANDNSILSNMIWDITPNRGLYMDTAHNNRICRNLFSRCPNDFMYLIRATNTKIFNNTIFRSGNNGLAANNSIVTLYNNIFLSNNRGVNNSGGGTAYLGYNDLYGNTAGHTQGGCIWGPGNAIGDPMLDTGGILAITSAGSAAVDGGKQIAGVTEGFQGTAPDMGWLESPFALSGPFYVDDNSGDDSNNGTFLAPYRTIQRAVNRMAPGVNVTAATCYIFPGLYREKVLISSNRNPGFMTLSGLSNTAPVLFGSLATNFGLKLTNANRVVLSGLTVKAYVTGVFLRGTAASNEVRLSTVYSNSSVGIAINSEDADRNLVRRNDLWGSQQDHGIYLSGGDGNTVRSNLAHNNQISGIHLAQAASLNDIRQNTLYGNADSGLYLGSDSVVDNRIAANYFRGPGQVYAVRLADADRNSIVSNIIRRSTIGIYLANSSSSNLIAWNTVYSNNDPGIQINSPQADGNRILGNEFWGQSDDPGISVSDGDHNLVLGNRSRNNQYSGIMLLGSACSNQLRNNSLYSNGSAGLWIYGDLAEENLVVSNAFTGGGQSYGIRINNGRETRLFRNLFSRNQTNIYLADATNIKVYNNTIFGASGLGVFANNSIATLLNNIILSNGDYGVQKAGSSAVFLGYNDLYGNLNGPTNGGIIWGAGNIQTDPAIDTAGSFGILRLSSPCVDSGTVIAGVSDSYLNAGPDMGWKEFFYDTTAPVSTADKESGFYSAPFQVTLTGTDPESPGSVTIYYTLDGSDPVSSTTRQSGLSPITVAVNNTSTLKFYAVNLAGLAEEKVNIRQYDFIRIPQEEAAVYNNLLDLSKGEKALIVFGKAGSAEIKIYTMRGVLVRSWPRRQYNAGDAVEWDGTVNDTGRRAGSGIYFAALRGDINITLKMIVVK